MKEKDKSDRIPLRPPWYDDEEYVPFPFRKPKPPLLGGENPFSLPIPKHPPLGGEHPLDPRWG
jgi:hypothetical protein